MKIARIISLIFLVLAVSGCVTTEKWSTSAQKSYEDAKLVVDPPLNIKSTKEVGESLFKTGIRRLEVNKHSIITLSEDAEGSFGLMGGVRPVKAKAGTKGMMLTHSSSANPMLCVRPNGESTTIPSETAGCFVDTNNDGKFDAIAFPGYAIDNSSQKTFSYKVEQIRKESEIENPKSYWVEVLYQGISKGEIKISYREFKGGVARPAFTQDISYEIKPDGTSVIAFKGMRIDVEKATNENITYTVRNLGNVR